MRSHSNHAGVGVVCAACAALALPLIFGSHLQGDEYYHYPLAVAFSRGFPLFSDTYSSAYMPLPYIITGLLMRVSGTSLAAARLVNLALGIVGIIGFYRLTSLLNPKGALWPTVFLAAYPYYLRNCSVYYMGNYSTVLCTWALFFYLRRRNRRDAIFTAVLLGAAALSAQWSLAVVGAVILCEALRMFDDRWNWIAKRARDVSALLILILVFQIPAAAVFIGWGGLTNRQFAEYELSLDPTHVVGALSVLGFYFCFWIVSRIKRVRPMHVAALVVFLPLLVLGLPKTAVEQGPGNFTGFSARLMELASHALGLHFIMLMIPAALLGLFLLSFVLDRDHPAPAVFKVSALLILSSYAASAILGETHVQLMVVTACVLIWADAKVDTWLKLAVVQCCVVGVLYAVYHAFFKVNVITP